MCRFFSCVVLTVGEFPIRWMPPTSNYHSHEDVIRALNLRDNGDGRFIRLECLPPFSAVTLDETAAPAVSWWREHEHEIAPRVMAIARRIAPLYADYDDKCDALYADYTAEVSALYADYKAKCDALHADYKAKRAPLYADYEAKRAPLDADYEAKRVPRYADYEAKCAPLAADYEAQCAALDGYVPAVAPPRS